MIVQSPIFLVDKDIPFSELIFNSLNPLMLYGHGKIPALFNDEELISTKNVPPLGRIEFFEHSEPESRPDILKVADVIAVRSSTRVGDHLLSQCEALKAIATPVIGTDHIDFDAVARAERRLGYQIPVFNAPGSTADAVADWTVSAICKCLKKIPRRVAVIGVGNVGKAVISRLELLRIPYLTSDPGLAAEPGFTHIPLWKLEDCDVMTFHVPLTNPSQSPWPTLNMVSTDSCLKYHETGCRLLVNSSRGEIVHEGVFSLPSGKRPLLACDVFRNEPTPASGTISACDLATPHIAGSGRYGRLRAALMIRAAVCGHLGLNDTFSEALINPLPQFSESKINSKLNLVTVTAPGKINLGGDFVGCDGYQKINLGGDFGELIGGERPVLKINPGAVRRGDGFEGFMRELGRLSGTGVSDEFKRRYVDANEEERASIFLSIRRSGTRTEPSWSVCNN